MTYDLSRYCLFTNDVETHSIWYNKLRDITGKTVMEEGMPILLDIYKEYGIKSTFFFTGYIAEKFPDIVRMILDDGHEVGSHGYSHEVDQAFDSLNLNEQINHLKRSKEILEQICGEEVISFRAPALRVNKFTYQALVETGFKIDSSVASQRFDVFLSFGAKDKLNWLTAPRSPYRTAINDLFNKGEGQIIEVPLSAFLFPYLGTTMRIFPKLTSIQRSILSLENSFTGKPIVFDIHPNEFIEEGRNNRKIERRSKNYISYLLKDIVRGKLKAKNLGRSAVPLYRNQINFMKQRNYHFVTIKEYAKETGLL